ncbi:helix-hairpin-helix domain-containing protein, partial [Staphylococcus epidermidis]|uniref:helix-hairpin-helix domain-containing protein n=1 Tax=Staphylococcus epidermidis TaxID=1282 RepID=UPI0021B1D4A4
MPPNINQTHSYYNPTNKPIYLSLPTIKPIPYQTLKLIIHQPHHNPPYTHFFHFSTPIPKTLKNTKLLHSLILLPPFHTFP